MQREILDFLKDIQREIQFLQSQTNQKDYITFVNDAVLTRACERSLEIIGEAVKNIPSEFRMKYPLIEWRDFAGMRDKLIHHYFGIDYEIVWSVIQSELPDLKDAIGILIEQTLESESDYTQ